jgi:hypothetical protein
MFKVRHVESLVYENDIVNVVSKVNSLTMRDDDH